MKPILTLHKVTFVRLLYIISDVTGHRSIRFIVDRHLKKLPTTKRQEVYKSNMDLFKKLYDETFWEEFYVLLIILTGNDTPKYLNLITDFDSWKQIEKGQYASPTSIKSTLSEAIKLAHWGVLSQGVHIQMKRLLEETVEISKIYRKTIAGLVDDPNPSQ
jgi:hypothetical protein